MTKQFGTARAELTDTDLNITTGEFSVHWNRTEQGLSCSTLQCLTSGETWGIGSDLPCDWDLTDPDVPAIFDHAQMDEVDSSLYTDSHLRIVVGYTYPTLSVDLEYVISCYPGAAGVRVQLRLRAREEYDPLRLYALGMLRNAFTFPAPNEPTTKHAIGYNTDTQNRNHFETPLLEHAAYHSDKGQCDWANVIFLERDSREHGGLAVVKESHKCPNQRGYDTGGFEWCTHPRQRPSRVTVSGWGIQPADVLSDRYRDSWAVWIVAYTDDRYTALKAFDRRRYPVRKDRDVYVMSNLWGSSTPGHGGRRAATEASVLEEIEIGSSIGVDVVQIDDGWQVPGHDTWKTPRWTPHPSKFPSGWAPVRRAAESRGMDLGLWAAHVITAEELIENQREGGFRCFKIDFSVLDRYDEIERVVSNQRELAEAATRRVAVNWDLTEISPRMGYFFGRDFGTIYLENRKPAFPESVVYRPAVVLRDAWHLAWYLNLNQFQITIQNCETIDRERSDAWRYPQDYCTAIAIMGAPILFMELKYLSSKARELIARVVTPYREHRERMFDGYVYPIGNEPSGRTWTGFQCVLPDRREGYITVFRELESRVTERAIRLWCVPDGRVRLTDLMTGTESECSIVDSSIRFTMEDAPEFRYLHYVIDGGGA